MHSELCCGFCCFSCCRCCCSCCCCCLLLLLLLLFIGVYHSLVKIYTRKGGGVCDIITIGNIACTSLISGFIYNAATLKSRNRRPTVFVESLDGVFELLLGRVLTEHPDDVTELVDGYDPVTIDVEVTERLPVLCKWGGGGG